MELSLYQETKIIIKSLIISSRIPMTIHELSIDFEKQEGHVIPYKKFGYESLLDFLKSINDVVYIDKNILKVVSSEKTRHLENLVAQQKGGRSNVVNLSHSFTTNNTNKKLKKQPKNILETEFPDFAVPFDAELKPYPIHTIELDSVPTVLLCQYIDALTFWFSIVNKNKDEDKFAELIKDMQNYYNDNNNNLINKIMPLHLMKPKQLVACKYENLWMRGKIISTIESSEQKSIEINLVDCEITAEIPLDKIKYLAKEHIDLPIQAIKGRLFGVKALKNICGAECNYYFEKITEKCVWAKVVAIDKKRNVHVVLIDVDENNELININKMMLDNEYAKSYKDLPVDDER